MVYSRSEFSGVGSVSRSVSNRFFAAFLEVGTDREVELPLKSLLWEGGDT